MRQSVPEADGTDKVRVFECVSSGVWNEKVTVLSGLALRQGKVVGRYVYEMVQSLVQDGGFCPSSTFT